jgi:hypothetical protein
LGFRTAQKGPLLKEPYFALSGRFARQANPALIRNLANYIAREQGLSKEFQ